MQNIKPSVTLIDSNPSYLESLNVVLKSLGRYHISATYTDAQLALKRLRKDRSELIIVGDLTDENCESFISEVNSENNLMKILVLQDEFTAEGISRLLAAGAGGLMNKSESFDDIVNAIDTVLKGGAPMSWSVTGLLIGFFQKNPHCPLTKRERTVLLMQTKGKTYSEIGRELIISPETVRMHIRNTYLKLNVNSKSAAIEKALTEKYILSY